MSRGSWLIWVLMTACSGPVDDHLNVVSDGAVLPVSVRGNAETGRVVLYESGGPSGPGIGERMVGLVDFEDTLEQDGLVVMYDRRGTGNARGNYTPDDLTMEALLTDLGAVHAVIDEVYAPEHTVLMGHSFGTVSAPMYVDANPGAVDGLVMVGPVWTLQDADAQLRYRVPWACRVAEDHDDPVLPALEPFCGRDPATFSDAETDAFYELLNDLADRLEPWPGMDTWGLLEAVFGSQYNLVDTQLRDNRISGPIWDDLEGTDLFAVLSRIDAPTVVVTGELDPTSSTELGEDGVRRMSDAALVELQGAGHYPFPTHPNEVRAVVNGL